MSVPGEKLLSGSDPSRTPKKIRHKAGKEKRKALQFVGNNVVFELQVWHIRMPSLTRSPQRNVKVGVLRPLRTVWKQGSTDLGLQGFGCSLSFWCRSQFQELEGLHEYRTLTCI